MHFYVQNLRILMSALFFSGTLVSIYVFVVFFRNTLCSICNFERYLSSYSLHYLFCPRKLYVLLSFVSEECLIENDIRSYSYLTNGYVPVITGDDDVELYRQVLEAMDVLGFTKDEQIGQFPLFFDFHLKYVNLQLIAFICLHPSDRWGQSHYIFRLSVSLHAYVYTCICACIRV